MGDKPFKPDLGLGRTLRDDGMARVEISCAEWFPEAQKVVLRLCQLYPGRTLTGEKLRNAVTMMYRAPPKPQITGALVNWAKKQGLIVLTGDRRQMEDPRSHARSTDEYRIVAR